MKFMHYNFTFLKINIIRSINYIKWCYIRVKVKSFRTEASIRCPKIVVIILQQHYIFITVSCNFEILTDILTKSTHYNNLSFLKIDKLCNR